ncbi:MAG: tetratricopeptide repeat protein [Deinococcota bacterium]
MAKHRLSDYIALDRRHALAKGTQLAERNHGSALFADVSGFTSLTEALVRSLGERRGAEALPRYLNQVYDALISDVNRFDGSVIGFAGDAITCWFSADDGYRALICALSMQQSMEQFHNIEVTPSIEVSLAMKVAIATGPVRRFAVGDPDIQLIDVIAGETLTHMAKAEHNAERGEIVLAEQTALHLANRVQIQQWREVISDDATLDEIASDDVTDTTMSAKSAKLVANSATPSIAGSSSEGSGSEGSGSEGSGGLPLAANPAHQAATTNTLVTPPAASITERYAVVDKFTMGLTVFSEAPEQPLPEEINPRLPEDDYQALRNWILPPVYDRLKAGQGEFLTELRPTTAFFLRFGGLDYDGDPQAGDKLDRFIRWVQNVLQQYDATLIQLTVGDKGSYLYASFGAPIAHEDDSRRALRVALELQTPTADMGISDIAIGVAQGTMRTGAYGGITRRTYGVLGDDVNLAARLMGRAEPGQILVSEDVYQAEQSYFQWQALDPVRVKGKREPINLYKLVDVTNYQGYAPLASQLPLIGRDSELEQLVSNFERVQQGRGHFAVVRGDAGMGKSRLISGLLEEAVKRDSLCCIHTGECQSYGRNSGYLVWQSLWRGLLEVDHTVPTEASEFSANNQLSSNQPSDNKQRIAKLEAFVRELSDDFGQRFPLLAPLVNLPIADNSLTASLEPQLRKSATESLLSDILQALAARSRAKGHVIILVLEDVQWIDALSLDLLEVLVRASHQSPVLILASERPATSTSTPDEREPSDNTTVVASSNEDISEDSGILTDDTTTDTDNRVPNQPDDTTMTGTVSQLASTFTTNQDDAERVTILDLAELSDADMKELILSKLAATQSASEVAPSQVTTATQAAPSTTTANSPEPPLTLPDTTLARFIERAQGNPFYIEELLNYATTSGLDLYDPTAWQDLALPNSLHSLILTRIDQLDKRDKHLQVTLKVASVIGRSLYQRWLTGFYPELGASKRVQSSLETLCALLLLDKERSNSVLLQAPGNATDTAQQADPSQLSDDEASTVSYVFKQIITRDVAYESLPFETRATLHKRFGDYLERFALESNQEDANGDGTPDGLEPYLDLLAYHFDQSSDAVKACDYLARAGNAAQARYDNQAAIRYYQKVLDYLDDSRRELDSSSTASSDDASVQNARQRVDVLLNLAKVLQLVGEWDQAQVYFEEALRCAQRDCQQPTAEAKSAMALGNLLIKRNQYDTATHWLHHAQKLWENQPDSADAHPSISHILTELGTIAWHQGDHEHARQLLGRSLDMARARDDKLNMSNALRTLGGIAFVESNYDLAKTQFEQALALTRQLNNRSEIIKYQSNLGAIALGLKDYDDATKQFSESLELASAIGAKEQVAGLLINLGVTYSERNDFAKAKPLYERGLKFYRDMGKPSGAADSLLSLGVIANEENRLEEAEQLYRESLALSSEHKDRLVILYFNLAVVLEQRADFAQSERYFEQSVDVAQQIGDTLGVAYGLSGLARSRLRFDSSELANIELADMGISTDTNYDNNAIMNALSPQQAEQLSGHIGHSNYATDALILIAATSAILEEHGLSFNQKERDKLAFVTVALRLHLAERASDLWAQGTALSVEQAVAYALTTTPDQQVSDQQAPDQQATNQQRLEPHVRG